jgi:putative DNA primase/helicase
MKTADKARGKWRGILVSIGVDQKFLTGKHGPCPFCEGRDRFRWDNSNGSGSFYCAQCGAGDGLEFVKRAKGCDFKTAALKVDEIVSGVKAEPIKQRDTSNDRGRLRELWGASKPIIEGDLAWSYLSGRGALPRVMPTALRFASFCRAPDGSSYPAMIALVSTPDGAAGTIHRTFLSAKGKADLDNPRALMPGEFPAGGAVRLYDVAPHIGIAEGIETAIKAAKRFRLPVWAAVTARGLTDWKPPHGVERVTVFGDCDHNFTGQAAAYTLANRLVIRNKIETDVKIPDTLGTDWADV